MKRLERLREMETVQSTRLALSNNLADLLDEARVVEQAIRSAMWQKDLIKAAQLQSRFAKIGDRAEVLLRELEA
jgi:hypothetical protein